LTNEHDEDEEVGESVCYAHLVCPACGRMLDDIEHATHCDETTDAEVTKDV